MAAACALLDKDLRDRRKTSEADVAPLLPASYASLLGGEAARRLKTVPTAFYRQPPEVLFGSSSGEGGGGGGEGDAAAPDFPGWAL